MQTSEIEKLKRKRSVLLERLIRLEGWTTGSIVTTERKRNSRRYPFHYLSRSVDGSNKITYIGAGELKDWSGLLSNGKKARKLFDRITELSIVILKCKKEQQ
jgi:hypothetical protein